MTIRDLRQRWPEAEAALREVEEILITRDSKPVAKLVRVSAEPARRERWDPEKHALWQKKVSAGKPASDSLESLARNRANRVF
jgi:antitoxin (DNA-binding transcriptional repressor) of toxin-antitoxin stability system